VFVLISIARCAPDPKASSLLISKYGGSTAFRQLTRSPRRVSINLGWIIFDFVDKINGIQSSEKNLESVYFDMNVQKKNTTYLLSAYKTVSDYFKLSRSPRLRWLTRRWLGGLCIYTSTEKSREV